MDDDDNFDLESFLPYQVSVLSGRLSRGLESRYRERSGLSIPEWRILCHLSQSDDISLGALKARVEMHVSRVSRAVQRLERVGYVNRRCHDVDRRRICLRLTGKGRGIMNDLDPLAISYQAEIVSLLGKDARGFITGLEQLLEKVES